MNIIETPKYKKSLRKVLKNKAKELDRLDKINIVFLKYKTLHDVLVSPYKNVYYIEQKTGNLKEYYTARINQKLRLVMKPIGKYPYNTIEITDIEFIDIDDKHYGEG